MLTASIAMYSTTELTGLVENETIYSKRTVAGVKPPSVIVRDNLGSCLSSLL